MSRTNTRLLTALTVLFVSMLGVLVAAGVFGLVLQDMTRSYVAGEGYYSKGHMAAVGALQQYARSGDPGDFQNYETAIQIPIHDGKARVILEDPDQPRAAAHPHFVRGLNHPDDVGGMSWMFRMFSETWLFRKPLEIWREGDRNVVELVSAADRLRDMVETHGTGSPAANAAAARILEIDARLRQLELDFSSQLGQTARELAMILIGGLIGLGLCLAASAVFFVRHVHRRMKQSDEAERSALHDANVQRNLLQTTLDNLDEGITFFDADLRLLLVNRRVEQILDLPEGMFGPGTPLGEVLRYNCRRGEYGDVDEDAYVEGLLEQARQFLPHHFTRERPDGSVIEVQGIPVQSGGMVTTYRDVSAEHHSRKALAASQQRTREVIDRSKDAFVSMDDQGHVFDWNPAAEEVFGWSRDEALGRPLSTLIIPKEHHSAHAAGLRRFLETGEARMVGRRFETEARHRDGRIFPVEITLGTQTVDGRKVFNAFIWDITERRETEHELMAARNRAEVANRSKSEFLANMSHELRTPLNAIIGFSEMMMLGIGETASARNKDYATNIHESGKHLLALINDILDLSRVEIGKVELDETEFSLAEATETCLKLLQHAANRQGVRFDDRISGNAPTIRGDVRRIRQILLNLLGNALKFSPEGGCVRIWTEADPEHITIFVADEGPGMEPHEAKTVFQPFVQLNDPMVRANQGAGLGLAIVKRFAELHQGSVSVDTAPGKGATMSVSLPAARHIRAAVQKASG